MVPIAGTTGLTPWEHTMATSTLAPFTLPLGLAIARANVAQGEFFRRYPHGSHLPYVESAVDRLPGRVAWLIEHGHPRSAEYWLGVIERMAGMIDHATLSATVGRLGLFELIDAPAV